MLLLLSLYSILQAPISMDLCWRYNYILPQTLTSRNTPVSRARRLCIKFLRRLKETIFVYICYLLQQHNHILVRNVYLYYRQCSNQTSLKNQLNKNIRPWSCTRSYMHWSPYAAFSLIYMSRMDTERIASITNLYSHRRRRRPCPQSASGYNVHHRHITG